VEVVERLGRSVGSGGQRGRSVGSGGQRGRSVESGGQRGRCVESVEMCGYIRYAYPYL
jgi:hypothetical protein